MYEQSRYLVDAIIWRFGNLFAGVKGDGVDLALDLDSCSGAFVNVPDQLTWIKIVSIVIIRHFACIASHISSRAYTVWLGWASLMFTLGLSFMYSTTHFLPGSKLFCIKSLRYLSLTCKIQPTIQFKSAWLVCCHLQQKMHISYEETLVIVWH